MYGIQAYIHSGKGCCLENEIMEHLYEMYGVKQSTTTPYNPCGNSQCGRLSHMLHGLLKTL